MKSFYSFVRKEFYHIFRDWRTMLILLLMPIVQIILFGFAITTEVKNVKLAILDPSKDVVTTAIVEMFSQNPYFSVVKVLQNPSEIQECFRKNEVGMVLAFSENFASRAKTSQDVSVMLMTDGTEPNQASMIVGYAQNILSEFQQSQSMISPTTIIRTETRMLYNPQSKSAYNFVPGVMGMIMILICAMMTSISIVREKETGTLEVLLSSPINPLVIVLSKAVPYLVLSLVNLVTILLLSVYVLGVPIQGSLLLLTLSSLLFIMLSLGLGLLISTLVETQLAAMLVSGMGFMMPVMLLSGLVYPIESMPVVLQWLSSIVPARWYIALVRKVMIQGCEIQYVIKELFVMFVMTTVCLLVAIKKFKTRLE